MKWRTISVTLLLAIGMFLGSIPAAFANHNANGPQTTGGVVINSCNSEGSIYVSRDKPADYYSVVPTCKRSDQPASRPIMKNVQGFKVAPGYQAINTKTGYIYVGGQWHYMCCNNTTLTLRVDWLENNKAASTINAAPISMVIPLAVGGDRICLRNTSDTGTKIHVEYLGSRGVGFWDYVAKGECSDEYHSEQIFEFQVLTGEICYSDWGHAYKPGLYGTSNINGTFYLKCKGKVTGSW